jgi:ankyrin repeat protein
LFSHSKNYLSFISELALCVCVGESISQSERTALIFAASRGHVDCVRLLIDAGADKDAKDNVRVGR